MKEYNDPNDTTNWKAWYVALALVLAAQIVVFLILTKSYE